MIKIKDHITEKVLIRFWNNVNKTNSCWEWTGWKDRDGYGHVQIRLPGKNFSCLSHRLSWVFHNEQDFPEDKPIARHLCNNPACVRPDHIMPGTPQENMNDAKACGSIKASARRVLGKRIMTPVGIFDTIVEAREALNIPRSTMDKYLREGNRGYKRLSA